ncbi:MAG: hypothetical protein LAN71_17730 [Acidobacteriia bacterium]|nr:hypothetical protein [Terriglobia bacterium]
MRLTYSDIKTRHFTNIGKYSQETDAALLADFNSNLGSRYQLILANIASYINQESQTASTVATQQYYHYPVGIQSIDNMTITIGSYKYTLSPIYSQTAWNQLNALTIQPTAITQFYFPRRDDFGLWPIPQAVYTITFNGFMRDRNLLVADASNGTVTLTNGSATVTGVSTSFTEAMEGRWFTVTTTSQQGQGYWYRVSSVTSTTVLTLETVWAGSNAAAVNYRIGESPELPEEAHILLPDGTASNYYGGLRNDQTTASIFDNLFWTGSRSNTSRDKNDKNISAGLIGLIHNYENRDRSNLIYKVRGPMSPYWKVWSTTLS